jgi:predicted  nucleic acid-binding Zn-ribbon protein
MADSSKIDEALSRFEAALRRFEAAAMRVHNQLPAGLEPPAEVQALRDDHGRLQQEVAEIRAKASELADRNRNAATKIDSAMAKIKFVLGSA